MPCIGDGIAGYNTDAQCYRIEGCSGCEKCWVKCEPKCEECPTWTPDDKCRAPEPGDFVTVVVPILGLSYKGPRWTPVMQEAVGRTAWVKNGDPVNGYSLKFTTTQKDVLDQFQYPLEALKLAMPRDVEADKMIKNVKEGNEAL